MHDLERDQIAKIKVIGVGGGGNNATVPCVEITSVEMGNGVSTALTNEEATALHEAFDYAYEHNLPVKIKYVYLTSFGHEEALVLPQISFDHDMNVVVKFLCIVFMNECFGFAWEEGTETWNAIKWR